MPSLKPSDLAAVAHVLSLLHRFPPKDESWDRAKRWGPHLEDRLRSWPKENM